MGRARRLGIVRPVPAEPPALAERLARRALELVDIPSESRSEAAIATRVQELLAATALGGRVRRFGNALVTEPDGAVPGALLVGHLDTVPAQGNIPGRLESGVVFGLGACDMKGALAVMLELAANEALEAAPVGWLFYDREELPVAESGLTPLFESCPWLTDIGLAIVMEPTAAAVQMGCLGNLSADVVFSGRSCHSARPWLGENAIHKGMRALLPIAEAEPAPDEVDGLVFTEVVSVTTIAGGIARNVVPDELVAHVNLRYSPRRGAGAAEELLRSLVGDEAELRVVGNSPGARPCAANPWLRRLQDAGVDRVEAKQAWTDVAQFAARGIDAVNFGPGDPVYAHARDEQVSVAALVESYETLLRVLT